MSKSVWQELAALFDITIEDLEKDISRPDRNDGRLMPVLQAIGIPVNDGDEAEKLWDHFQANQLNPETTRGSDFRHFQQQGGETLRYYATFSTIQKKYRSKDLPLHDWRNWPTPLRHPRSMEVAAFAQQHEE